MIREKNESEWMIVDSIWKLVYDRDESIIHWVVFSNWLPLFWFTLKKPIIAIIDL